MEDRFQRRANARARFRVALAVVAVAGFCAVSLAYAGPIGLTINATFDPSLDADEQAAIDTAIANVEATIASPNNIAVSIYFNSMSGGLGESDTSPYGPSYLQYYNAYAAVAKSADQLEALASLGAPPTSLSPGNPVNGNTDMIITTPEARNLGFSAPGGINSSNSDGLVNGDGTYDGAIGLNTLAAVPPDVQTGSEYSLQSVAAHEIDEVLGIGGSGSTLPGDSTQPVGDLDLYRYSAPGVSSYTASNTVESYFSIDGGTTVLAHFNQEGGGSDYGDWIFSATPQVQDAFATEGVNPVLGPNEITALNVIGYEVIPEPSTFALVGLGLLGFGLLRRRQSANR